MADAIAKSRSLPDVTAPAVELAPRLLGCLLVRETAEGRRAGVIVETEAYPGGLDEASHTRRGLRTRRNEPMWRRGGCAYVYFTYGVHWMCNVVSGGEGSGEAVLLRALEPLEGLELMRSRRGGAIAERELCRGPARLTKALDIDGALNREDLLAGTALRLEPGSAACSLSVLCGPRIGVGYAGRWARERWRFFAAGSPFVSRPLPESPRLWRAGPPRR